MKLTGSLKEKVNAVDTKEEKKAIIAEAGMELTDDELEGIAGGRRVSSGVVNGFKCSCGMYLSVSKMREHLALGHTVS